MIKVRKEQDHPYQLSNLNTKLKHKTAHAKIK